MNTSHTEQDPWESCPPGALVNTVRALQTRQRERRRIRILGLTGSSLVVLFLVAVIAQQFGRGPTSVPNVGKITCATVMSLLPAYIAGELPAATASEVEKHLDGCPHCRQRYDNTKDKTARLVPVDAVPGFAPGRVTCAETACLTLRA